jgi:hypothetical protein
MRSRLNAKSIEVEGSVERVLTNILSPIFSQNTLSFHTVNIEEFTKLPSYRAMFKEHPLYNPYNKTKEELRRGAGIILDSIIFDEWELTFSLPFKGFRITGKASFLGETSKFYLPAGLIYSIMNNRIETSIPRDFVNVIIEVNAPAIAFFDMYGTSTSYGKKILISDIHYLFKDFNRYLTVKPFSYLDDRIENRTITLRFFEFLLNLTQFFNENEKVEPYFHYAKRPEILTGPLFEHLKRYREKDPAHDYGVNVTPLLNLVAPDRFVVEQVNRVYTRVRTSFPFLGQDPIEALKNFIELLKLVG